MAHTQRLTQVFLLCFAIALTGCSKKAAAPEIRVLSDQEASDLWNKAESHEAVGDPVVKVIHGETGTTVTTSQAYMLRGKGGAGGGLVTVCGGSCTLNPGGTFGGCQTSGCTPSGNSCTPLVCSGSCRNSSPCQAQAHFGFFSGGASIAAGPEGFSQSATAQPPQSSR